MRKKTVLDVNVRNKRVLLRDDLNVPLEGREIADDSRIRSALPTIEYLISQDASIIICSHLGRPGGEVVDNLSLRPIADRLSALLERDVGFISTSIGPEVEARVSLMQPGEVLLLENLRFYPEEENNSGNFAKQLSGLAELFVNDAFGVSHRAHASMVGVADLLPSVAGFLMITEIKELGNVFSSDRGKIAVVSGGAKVSDKLSLLRSVVKSSNLLCIGGAMANTFLMSQGFQVGASLVETDRIQDARDILALAKNQCEVLLPTDCVIAEGIEASPRARPLILSEEEVPPGWSILDVGPQTLDIFSDKLKTMNVVVWNGPLGLSERQAFAGGSWQMARHLAQLNASTIVCGGTTVQAVHEAEVSGSFTHLSSGGGAALELLTGQTLPGIDVLLDAE